MDPTDDTGTDVPPMDETKPQDSPAEEQEEQAQLPGPTLNLLPKLLETSSDWVDQQCKIAARRTKDGLSKREQFMERRANQLRLFTGNIPALGPPAEGAKAPSIMIMCKALTQVWARIVDQVIPAKGDIIHASPSVPGDDKSAIERERHLNWQLRHEMPEWASGHQVNILSWLQGGSTIRRYRYDPIEENHRIDYVPVDDYVMSYKRRDDHPLMKDRLRSGWITYILRLSRWEAEAYVEKGTWSNLEEIYPADDDDQGSTTSAAQAAPQDADESAVQDVVIEVEGVEPPERGEKDGEREYLEHYCMLRFPKKSGVDAAGKTKPCILTIDRITKKPVCLTIREKPDPQDQSRFQAQAAAHAIAAKNALAQSATTGTTVPPPPAPKPAKMKTIYDAIHYRLIPNPDGAYGLGLGYLLESSNELANALAAEYLTGARFENLKGGFMAKGTREKRGDIPWVPGKFVETEIEPELLDKALKFLQFGPPSEGLMRVVAKLEENAEITADTEVLSGEKGSSNETAKGLQIRNANAMTLIMVITRLYLECMKYEIQMIAEGNALQMQGPKTFPFKQQTGPDQNTVQMVTVTPEHYAEGPGILEFTADARMASKPERVSDAKDMLQMILNSPLVQNPQLLDFGFRHLFRMAELPEYEAAMGPPPQPPQPPPPPQPMSQDDENAGFFNEQDHPVLPDDNHMEHLHHIAELRQSPLHEHLSSTGKQMLDRHERAHVSQFYLQMQKLKAQTGLDVHGMARMAGRPPGGGVPAGAPGPQGGPSPSPAPVGPNGAS